MGKQLLYEEPSFEMLEIELRGAVMAGSGGSYEGGHYTGGGEMEEGGEV